MDEITVKLEEEYEATPISSQEPRGLGQPMVYQVSTSDSQVFQVKVEVDEGGIKQEEDTVQQGEGDIKEEDDEDVKQEEETPSPIVTPQIISAPIASSLITAPQIISQPIPAPHINAPRIISQPIPAPHIIPPRIISQPIAAPHINAQRLISKPITATQINASRIISQQLATPQINAPRIISQPIATRQILSPSFLGQQIVSQVGQVGGQRIITIGGIPVIIKSQATPQSATVAQTVRPTATVTQTVVPKVTVTPGGVRLIRAPVTAEINNGQNREQNAPLDTGADQTGEKRKATEDLSPDPKSPKSSETAAETVEDSYDCTYCGEKFARKPRLSKHILAAHLDELLVNCPDCDFQFCNKRDLANHRKYHSGDKLFLCQRCGQAFKYMTNYISHMHDHMGTQPYECGECGAGFSSKRKVNIHVDAYHSGFWPYKCELCLKPFLEKKKFRRHQRKIHGLKIESGRSWMATY